MGNRVCEWDRLYLWLVAACPVLLMLGAILIPYWHKLAAARRNRAENSLPLLNATRVACLYARARKFCNFIYHASGRSVLQTHAALARLTRSQR
jgi:hypothetical protein